MPQPLQLHYWPTPNGWKVSIALEEMGLPYDMIPVNIAAGEQFAPDFLRLSPNNRIPALLDPEPADGGEPIAVFESGAILIYLGNKTGRFNGADVREKIEVVQWLMWQMGGLGPMAGQTHHFRQYAPTLAPDARMLAYGANRYTNETHRLYGVLDKRLKDRDFVAGDYSIADMAIWPWIVPWRAQGIDLEAFPNLSRWFERVGSRPAVQRGVKLGEALKKPLPATGPEADKARAALFGRRPA